ncbi:MAG: hypothetical protein V3T77_02670 [Planctomycetota bacterium]
MKALLRTDEDSILTAMAGAGYRPRAGGQGWQFTVRGRPALSVQARLEDEWLTLEALPAKCGIDLADPELPWTLLSVHGQLPGGVSFLLDRQRTCIRLRCDLWVHPEINLSAKLKRVSEGLRQSQRWLAGSTLEPPHGQGPRTTDLPSLCREAGWPFEERDEGKLAVTLEVASGHWSAQVAPLEDNTGVVVSVELARTEKIKALCRHAAGKFLISSGGALRGVRPVVRGVRPVVQNGGSVQTVLLEARLESSPHPGDLHNALSACSVGCRLCANEVIELFDEECSRAFLELTGK